jgi:D-alanine-D-alanine ligase
MGMNKEISKLMASFYGVPIVPYIKLRKTDKYELPLLQEALEKLGYPLFIKPVNLGSSIGVSRVEKPGEVETAIKTAFKYDDTLLIEKGIDKAREVFCAVMGDYQEEIHTSLCGELKTANNAFFDYEAKYNISGGCDMYIPAPLEKSLQDNLRKASYDIFKALCGNGFARVDFLISQDGKFYFSEINTIPGMSLTSLFPQLMEASGKKYPEVLDILISTAIKRKAKQNALSLEK